MEQCCGLTEPIRSAVLPHSLPAPLSLQFPEGVPGPALLENNAEQSVAAVIDNALYGFPYFFPGVVGHTVELIMHSLIDQRMQGFAKNV